MTAWDKGLRWQVAIKQKTGSTAMLCSVSEIAKLLDELGRLRCSLCGLGRDEPLGHHPDCPNYPR